MLITQAIFRLARTNTDTEIVKVTDTTDHHYSCTDAFIQCKGLVKIVPVTSEYNRAKVENCAATRPQVDDCRSFGTLAFRNGLEYHSFDFDFSKLIGNDFCTFYGNFMGFGSVPGV